MASSHHTPHILPAAHTASSPFLVPDPQPQEFPSEICGMIGIETHPGSDSYLDPDGEVLKDARLTPSNAWVCSRACLSQLMFQSATEDQQEALARLNRALATIAETVPALAPLLSSRTDVAADRVTNLLCAVTLSASGLEEILAVKDEPAWVNEPTPEDVLEREMRAIREISGGMALPQMQAIHKRACAALGVR